MPVSARSLSISGVSVSAGGTAAITYSICSLVVALFPRATSVAISYVLHLDLTAMARPISWRSYCVGVVAISVAMGLMFALAAVFYNRLIGEATVAGWDQTSVP